jgi:hypothetical protein
MAGSDVGFVLGKMSLFLFLLRQIIWSCIINIIWVEAIGILVVVAGVVAAILRSLGLAVVLIAIGQRMMISLWLWWPPIMPLLLLLLLAFPTRHARAATIAIVIVVDAPLLLRRQRLAVLLKWHDAAPPLAMIFWSPL